MTLTDNTKKGRPRVYTLEPIASIPNPNLAMVAAMLQELRERVIDQVIDLPIEALPFHPEGTSLSIGALIIHLVWAEARWIHAVTECDVPPEFWENINDIGQAIPAGQEPPAFSLGSVELAALCRRIGEEVTNPALAELEIGFDSVITGHNHTMTPRGVLMHLVWHWTYHSAHIGLLREQWGSDYTWTFGSLGA